MGLVPWVVWGEAVGRANRAAGDATASGFGVGGSSRSRQKWRCMQSPQSLLPGLGACCTGQHWEFPAVRLCQPDGFHPLTAILLERGTGWAGSAVLVRYGFGVILSACRWDV